MTVIRDSGELMEKLCGALGAGAFGEGEISVFPKGGSEFVKLYEGGIIRQRAVVAVSGRCGKRELLERLDGAVKRGAAFKGGGIIRISAPECPVIAHADEKGFVRLERDIEIIYSGVV